MDYYKKKRTRGERNKLRPVIDITTKRIRTGNDIPQHQLCSVKPTAITSNRLTMRLGMFNQGKQSQTIRRDKASSVTRSVESFTRSYDSLDGQQAADFSNSNAAQNAQPIKSLQLDTSKGLPDSPDIDAISAYLTAAIDVKAWYPTAPDYCEKIRARVSSMFNRSDHGQLFMTSSSGSDSARVKHHETLEQPSNSSRTLRFLSSSTVSRTSRHGTDDIPLLANPDAVPTVYHARNSKENVPPRRDSASESIRSERRGSSAAEGRPPHRGSCDKLLKAETSISSQQGGPPHWSREHRDVIFPNLVGDAAKQRASHALISESQPRRLASDYVCNRPPNPQGHTFLSSGINAQPVEFVSATRNPEKDVTKEFVPSSLLFTGSFPCYLGVSRRPEIPDEALTDARKLLEFNELTSGSERLPSFFVATQSLPVENVAMAMPNEPDLDWMDCLQQPAGDPSSLDWNWAGVPQCDERARDCLDSIEDESQKVDDHPWSLSNSAVGPIKPRDFIVPSRLSHCRLVRATDSDNGSPVMDLNVPFESFLARRPPAICSYSSPEHKYYRRKAF